MNSELAEIYYNPSIGLLSFEKFRAKVKEIYPEMKRKDIKEFYDNQEINQLNKKPMTNKANMYRITGPELSFQMDLMYVPKAIKTQEVKLQKAKEEGKKLQPSFYIWLLCIDILSRKAYIYSIPNKESSTIMKAYSQFLSDVKRDSDALDGTENFFDRNKPFGIVTDSEFDFHDFLQFNNDIDVIIDCQTAYNDHITGGDRLGMIDRLVRTLKNILMRFVYSTSGKQYSVPDIMNQIVKNYNDTPHRSLDRLTPNQAFNSRDVRLEIFKQNMEYNRIIDEGIPFNIGDTVRILNRREAFSKEKPQFSKGIYKVVENKGYKFYVEDSEGNKLRRALKPNEIQKIDENKIQHANPRNIEEEIQQNQKVVNNEQLLKRLDVDENNIITTKRQRNKPARFLDV